MAVYKNENGKLVDYTKSNTLKPDAELSSTSENSVQNKVIFEEIDKLKKSGSDGKKKVADAITEKGVETATDATFDVMADNIRQIETGGGELHGATISVTTTEENLVGMEVTLSLNGVIVQTKVFDENMICSFTDIQEIGTYVVYSSDGIDDAEFSVEITPDNIVNKTVISCEFYLTPDGETVTPVDDVAILLKCAEIKDNNYTTMDELLGDEQAIGDITMSENAMKYLARSTGFADDVCANETFMTYLGASAYVDETVLNSDYWVEKILNSDYVDSVLNDLVPTMTSNTLPSGEVICSSSNSNIWTVFDKYLINGDAVESSNGIYYIGYDFKNLHNIYSVKIYGAGNNLDIGNTIYIDVFYDSNWHQIFNKIITKDEWYNTAFRNGGAGILCNITKITASKIRIRSTEPNYSYNNLLYLSEIIVYGR